MAHELQSENTIAENKYLSEFIKPSMYVLN